MLADRRRRLALAREHRIDVGKLSTRFAQFALDFSHGRWLDVVGPGLLAATNENRAGRAGEECRLWTLPEDDETLLRKPVMPPCVVHARAGPGTLEQHPRGFFP